MSNVDLNSKSLVIVDCDPGIDDIWALIILLQGEQKLNHKVLAITTCNGNSTIDHTTQNALLALKTLNRLDVSMLCYF